MTPLPPGMLDGARKGRGRGGLRKEVEIMRAILGYLAARRIYAWRNNTGGALRLNSEGKASMVMFGLKGLPDILGAMPPTGRMIAVEVKRPGERPSPIQAMRIRALTDVGVLAFVATSIEDVARALDAAGVKRL